MIQKRNSTFELLRIISMLMIIACHYFWCMFCLLGRNPENVNLVDHLMSKSGSIGVALFFMITGYFSTYAKQRLRLKKILICYAHYYALNVIAFVYMLVKKHEYMLYSKTESIGSVADPFNSHLWFVTAYIFLTLLAPYLNEVVDKLSAKSVRQLCICMFIFFEFINANAITMVNNAHLYLHGILVGVFYYTVGACIRRHCDSVPHKQANGRSYVLLSSVCVMLWFASALTDGTIACVIPNAACAITLFIMFCMMPEHESRVINQVASTTFGIYLGHESVCLREVLFAVLLNGLAERTVPLAEQHASPYYAMYALLTILIVFLICMSIDLIRQKYFERRENELFDRLLNETISKT